MDKIILKGMKFFGRHGVLRQERELGQPFEVDLEIHLDLGKAGLTDDINQTVSYEDIFNLVEEIITGDSYNLIEALAYNISSRIMQEYNKINEVKVVIRKPAAPIKGVFDYMAVEINRTKE